MSGEHFSAALNLVIEGLEARSRSGLASNAPSAVLDALCRTQGPALKKEVHAAAQPDSRMQSSAKRDSSATPPTAERPLPSKAPAVKGKQEKLPPFPQLPDLEGDASRAERLALLAQRILPCTSCSKLAATRRHVVMGEGSPDAELMFVGEAPGAEEDQEGRPFAGEAGELLDKMLVAMGLSRSAVYLTTALKCRPDVPQDEPFSRAPSPEELERCTPFLAHQIATIKPRVIVALGAGAMRALFGSVETVGKLRSHWHDLQGVPVMPTFHPSYLIRNPANSEKRKVWEDLLLVLERLGHSISEKQRGYFKAKAR